MQTAYNKQSWVMAEPEIVMIVDRLDSTSAAHIAEETSLRIRGGAHEIIIDCQQLHSVTTIGLQAFLFIARRVKAAGGKLVVCNLSGQPKAMFEACGYQRLISTYDARDDAMTAIAA